MERIVKKDLGKVLDGWWVGEIYADRSMRKARAGCCLLLPKYMTGISPARAFIFTAFVAIPEL